jgi:hypothetical protein
MEKEFVPYEQALELKELGFDEPCFGYYVNNELRGINLSIEELGGKEPYYQRFDFHTISNHDIDNPNKIVVTAPLYQQAFRWFREKHDLYSQTPSTCVEENDRIFYNNPIYDELDNIVFDSMEQYTTYEEAEIACLKKLIEIVKNK